MLPKLQEKVHRKFLVLPEMETNRGNDIAENGRKKNRIMATKLPKMEGKKKMLLSQHFLQQITDG